MSTPDYQMLQFLMWNLFGNNDSILSKLTHEGRYYATNTFLCEREKKLFLKSFFEKKL